MMKYSRHLQQPEIRKLFSSGRKLSYRKGEIIQHANEPPQGVYFISKGYVKEYTLSNNGVEHLNIMYESGEIFSLLWVFLGARQNVFREAQSDVEVRLLPADKLKSAMGQNLKLQTEMTQMLMAQMYFLKLRVENLAFSSAYDKVAYMLLYLAGRYGEERPSGWYVVQPFRHQHIANSLSMSRETASRMIAKMERQGLIKQDKRSHFLIKDIEALANSIGVDNVLGMWPDFTSRSDKNH